MRALWPVAAVCLAGLCRCSLLVNLDGLGNATRRDASTDAGDTAASDGTAVANDGESPLDAAADGQTGPDDDGLDAGSAALDSPDEDGRSLPDGAATGMDGSAAGDVDATTDGAVSPPEAGSPDGGPACDPAKPFGPPVLVLNLLSNAKEGNFRLLPNELTGFFWSSRAGGPGPDNLYVTTRPDMKSPFGGPVLLNNVNSAGFSQFEPSVTNDGLNLAFRSNRIAGMPHIYWASRTDVRSDFSNIMLLGNVNSTSNDTEPFVAGVPNGTNIYFASDRAAGDYDIWHATGRAGAYNAPRLIPELSMVNVQDAYPVASDDDRTIFFSSSRPGGSGSNDIWMATRATNLSRFNAPTNVTQVNTPLFDRPDWLSLDGCRLYLTSDVTGNPHIYVATRPM